MAIVWTVKGEAGRTVDETERSLKELQMSGVEPFFGSLTSDTMTWSIWLKRPSQGATLVPDAGQRITLYRNGVRYFTGWVTGRDPLFTASRFGYSIRVEGPWYWLAKTSISSLVPDQTTVATERASYVFPTGTVRTHLIALTNRAISLGLPISPGSIATTFEIPRLTVREMSFGEAISEVMRWMADGIVYFDHSGDDETFPALCMQRRTPATLITLTPTDLCVPQCKLKARYDLQVEELEVFYARRDTIDNKRVTVWDSQSAGSSSSSLPTRQLVTVTGPELDLWLPQDFTDSVVVRSAAVSGNIPSIIAQYEERLRAAGASTFGVGSFTMATAGGGTFTLPAISERISDSEGNTIAPAFTHYLTKGQTREWWTKDGIEHINARVSATIRDIVNSPAPVPSGYVPTPPAWYEVMGGQQYNFLVDVVGVGLRRVDVYATTVSVAVPLVKTNWATDTTLIRSEDWGWFNPPANLAANLLATQNFVPMEGTVPIVAEEIPAGNAVGSVINIADFLPETEDMRALVSGYSVRLATGEITYTLGAPDRLAFRDLINRFRQTGADNIYYLSDYTPPNPGLPDNTVLNEDGTTELDEDGTIAIDES